MTDSAWERVGVVFAKEVTDNLRDRRSLGSTVMGAMLGPVLILILVLVLGKALFKQAEKPLEIPAGSVSSVMVKARAGSDLNKIAVQIMQDVPGVTPITSLGMRVEMPTPMKNSDRPLTN